MKGLTMKELNIGDKDSFEKTISESDVYLYAGITGDLNPAHINQREAETTMFKGRIAHGMLTAGLVSAVLGMKMPGAGTIYLGQELRFSAPVRFGDTIKAEVEVIEKFDEKNIMKLSTTCTNQDGAIVLKGIATVMPPK
ncbi:MaoC family dehydratase [Clostridium estertheticum]|uniref:MaoC family dehydratase n=1 Tax=Clostridium estertheticum TaxID=238834 RepID=UPI0013E9599C|nr:MaoC family dehydratase [Clostridium estertheticum]MBZ9685308.1 MaoC family dehydratase [Clostridium estertheticum]